MMTREVFRGTLLPSVVAAMVASCVSSVRSAGTPDGGLEASAEADLGRETSSETGGLADLDAAACFIETSNYDHSCAVDTDCV
jgi:hypothetical protein